MQGFDPKYGVDADSADPVVQECRRALIEKMDDEAAQLLEETLQKRWKDLIASMPPYMQMSILESSYEAFEKEHYFECMEEVLQNKMNKAYIYDPPVPPRNEEEMRLVQEVTVAQSTIIDARITRAWAEECGSMPAFVQCTLPRVPPKAFLEQRLYEIVSRVLREQGAASDASQSSIGPSEAGLEEAVTDPLAQFFTGKHEGTIAFSTVAKDATAHMGAMELLSSDVSGDELFTFQGYLLTLSPTCRDSGSKPSSPRKRGRSSVCDSKVMDIVAVDRTGPACITLWGEAADTLEHLILKFTKKEHDSSGSMPIISLTNMRPVVLKSGGREGEILTTTNTLHTVRGLARCRESTVELLEKPTSAFLLSAPWYIPPDRIVMPRVKPLEGVEAPFRVSLRGVAQKVSGVEESMQGNAKRSFALVDEQGYWVSCVAIGESATSTALVNGNEIILFFAHGRSASSSSEGGIRLFHNSAVWLVGKPRQTMQLFRQVHIA